jgi:hypothetical protein
VRARQVIQAFAKSPVPGLVPGTREGGAAYRIPPTDAYIPAMGRSLIPASLLLVLLGCAPQQVAAYRETQAYPQERGVVCAVKLGMRQNYWNAGLAQADGAIVIFLGECPAEPNSEGFAR